MRQDETAAAAKWALMRDPRITTDRTVDASSLETIVGGVVRPSMSEEEKARALLAWWRQTVYHYGWPYQRPERAENWHDPIKMINVHGYGLCGAQARSIGRLFARVFGDENTRLIGLSEAGPGQWRMAECSGAFLDTARLRIYPRLKRFGHTSVEVRYGGRWRLLDPEVGFYAYLRDGQGIAGAEDLIADPTLVTRPARRVPGLMPCGDISPVFYASTFTNWGSITRDVAPDDHTMDITLRRGESYTRYWDRKGPFVWFAEMDRRWDPEYLSPGPRHLCEGDDGWRHYGNGELVYRPRLSDDSYRDGVSEENGVAASRRGLRPERAGRRGSVTFAIKLPYLISQAALKLDLTRVTGSDLARVWVRPAGGRWRLIWEEPHCGRAKRAIDLSPWVIAKYSYEVRFDLKAARQAEHTLLHAVSFETTFMLNYLALPRLLPGRNRVTVEVADPGELRAQRLEVTYAWQDREGEHEETRVVTSSPYSYTLNVAPVLTQPAENPKYMRYLRMAVR